MGGAEGNLGLLWYLPAHQIKKEKMNRRDIIVGVLGALAFWALIGLSAYQGYIIDKKEARLEKLEYRIEQLEKANVCRKSNE